MQLDLPVFPTSERISLDDGELLIIRNWLAPAKAADCFQQLRDNTPWEQSTIFIAGRPVRIPRLNAWYGDPGADYQYSGRDFIPVPWSDLLVELRAAVQQTYCDSQPQHPQRFNSALLNLYRDGSDSVAWHADDEAELGPSPQIASLSLGATRRFLLKRRDGKSERVELMLDDGTLLFMLGNLQHTWVHALPKTRRAVGERVNITFRYVKRRRGR